MGLEREKLKIVVVGHVDHGKSTVIGRLLYDTKSVAQGKIERVKKVCKEKGKPFEYAYLLDAFEEEQKQGITIDTTQLQFFTDKRDYVIIDAPGHKEFLKNMISGAANAEAALLIIDAKEGVQEQSKRHGYILSLLGIQKVYVVVNKMDLIDYSEEKFNIIQQEMNIFLNSLHVYPIKYIPISAFYGENLTTKSEYMLWYKEEPVIEAIDLIDKDKGQEDKPLRFPIQDVYKFDHRRIIAGRIESGTIRVGDEIFISPSNKKTKVKSIEYYMEKDKIDVAVAGMSIGITVEDEFFNKRGEFISHVKNKPIIEELFRANLFWMGKNALVKNKKYKLKISTQEVECEIITINKVIDATNLTVNENAEEVKTNDVAEVTIKTKEKISYDEFKHNANTGRFVLVEGYDVCGGGIISKHEKIYEDSSQFIADDKVFKVNAFNNYYFLLKENNIKKEGGIRQTFSIGDAIPTSCETYSYPKTVDFIDIEHKLVARINNSILTQLINLDDYQYDEQILLDSNGLVIKVSKKDDFIRWQNDYNQVSESKLSHEEYANRWLDFNKYRKISFKDNGDQIIEFVI